MGDLSFLIDLFLIILLRVVLKRILSLSHLLPMKTVLICFKIGIRQNGNK